MTVCSRTLKETQKLNIRVASSDNQVHQMEDQILTSKITNSKFGLQQSTEEIKKSIKNLNILPNLNRSGKRYNFNKKNILKETEKILPKKRTTNNSFPLRILSRKSTKKETPENLNETKLLVSNRSSGYIEANKAVKSKIKLKGQMKLNIDAQLFDGRLNSVKYKFGMKNATVSF